MMRRVLIAANYREADGSVSAQATYLRAVRETGAVAACAYARDAAEADALAGAFDALLLPGGNDLPAAYFGQEPHIAAQYDSPQRDLSDRLLLEAFLKKGKRVLGICRGMQVANVFHGGTLHQHLPEAYSPVLWHSGNITGRHPASVAEGSSLAALLGADAIDVNSSHHQAVDKPGQGLRIVARAPDGVAEAAEGEHMLLVQWHPERMLDTMLPLFFWLIQG